MPGFMTPDQIADRTARALGAAVAAGRDLGIEVDGATVLHDMFSVVVHLAPSPVVARVPVVLPPNTDPDRQAAQQQAELDVVDRLARKGAPVIPPSPLVPRKPVRRDGFSMTFWQFVEQDAEAEPDHVRNAGLVADLHAAMRDDPGELPFLSAAEPDFVTEGLAALESRPDLIEPADLGRAQREWETLEPFVRSREKFEGAFPAVGLQPIHGDAPAVNVVATRDGLLHSDFELVTFGPVEWDLAFLGPEGEAAYNAAARRLGIRELDEHTLHFVNAVGMCRTVAALALAPQLPVLVEAMKSSIERWRATPFAGDLDG
ncbi:phosphotransferase [Nocardiopsis algeriensis]|uniref:Phosphotransferase family enzyme n=1 Tax=Nocardiopsis algeriensis TaxID=1478215 RepID=A0A841IQ96_9ACTN|nr:phosphotransferase [Nocardiopsis algeriensis]MBB6120292.1 hypothetical protein [Nocardiopsis algeriensis]